MINTLAAQFRNEPCRVTILSRVKALIKNFSSQAADISQQTDGYALYMWGQGNKGQLGIESEKGMFSSKPILTPQPLVGFELKGVIDVSCGENHTAIVTSSNQLMTFGKGTNFQLGLGSKNDVKTPTLVQSLVDSNVRVKSVSCGDHHTAILDVEGNLYTCGWNGSLLSGKGALGHGSANTGDAANFKLVEDIASSLKAVQVGAGENFTAILTDDGEVWTCGSGAYGRLGNGSTGDSLSFAPIVALEDKVITKISIGHAFVLALTNTGEVFGWGRNDGGQLGLGGGLSLDVYAMENLPRQIELLAHQKIVSIAAGNTHACAANSLGQLYMWGMSRYLEPEYMSVLSEEYVVDVGCGFKYTMAVTKDGDLFSFGQGRSCCLGHGNSTSYAQPTLVEFFAVNNLKVHKVSCGHRHVAALVSKS